MHRIEVQGKWKIKPIEPGAPADDLNRIMDDSWIDANVPGDIHNDLFNAGLIPDPYFSDNSLKCGWVTETDWLYRCEFAVDKCLLKRKTEIIFDGIDTFSTIWLNGKKLGDTENMFISYAFDVSDTITAQERNCLVIRIKSVKEIMKQYPSEGYYSCFNVQRIFIRKAQCHFGWDWAPDFPATGIFGGIKIISYDDARIQDVAVRTDVDGNVSFFVELNAKSNRMKARERLNCESEDKLMIISRETDEKEDYDLLFRIDGILEKKMTIRGQKNFCTMKIENPELWWPLGYGKAHLYDYTIILLQNGIEQDSITGRFGIKEVRVIEEPKSEGGFSFRFLINGVPVFIKGANWVPLDLMTGTIQDEKYSYMLDMAQKANINMLRVWGGGIYEKDDFYRFCDERGIMVWQDFMFACSDIPEDRPDFADLIIPEIEYQIRRLRNHACITYWCGGNEKTGSYGALRSYGDRTFNYLIRGICNCLDPDRPYGASSPFSYSDMSNDEDSGDTHCNAYQPALKSGIENYRKILSDIKCSFASEIALQGESGYKSLRRFIPENKLWPTNEIWELHLMKNPYDSLGTTFLQQQKQTAITLFGDLKDVKDFVKKSMAVHSEFMKAELEHHRSRKWQCGGAMFWMFSDIWPSSTWSVVDYYGIPKAAYYSVKRAFAPMITSILERDKEISIFIMNDKLDSSTGNAEFGQATLEGKILWKKIIQGMTVESNSVFKVADITSHIIDTVNSYIFIKFSGCNFCVDNTYFHRMWKEVEWPEPNIKFQLLNSALENESYKTTIRINTKNYARMVNISVEGNERALIDDNYFDMQPNETRDIIITTDKYLDIQQIRAGNWLTEWE